MGEFEKFLHDDRHPLPILVQAGLVHVQFETIHPFLDGNGRLGRLLITFVLCAEGVLREPLLYLSLYFKRNRQQYYDLLQAVRLTGDREAWLDFFLTGFRETADEAAATARQLMALTVADEQRIQSLGKAAGSALRVQRFLQRHPLASITRCSAELNLTIPPVTKAMGNLVRLGVVTEITGRKRNRVFAYQAYLRLLASDTEPLKSR